MLKRSDIFIPYYKQKLAELRSKLKEAIKRYRILEAAYPAASREKIEAAECDVSLGRKLVDSYRKQVLKLQGPEGDKTLWVRVVSPLSWKGRVFPLQEREGKIYVEVGNECHLLYYLSDRFPVTLEQLPQVLERYEPNPIKYSDYGFTCGDLPISVEFVWK